MIRKTMFAIATVAALGAAALAPTDAFAGGGKGKGGKHHWHGHHHWGFRAVVVAIDDDCGWKWYRSRGYWYKVWSCD